MNKFVFRILFLHVFLLSVSYSKPCGSLFYSFNMDLEQKLLASQKQSAIDRSQEIIQKFSKNSNRPVVFITDTWSHRPGGTYGVLKNQVKQLQEWNIPVIVIHPLLFPGFNVSNLGALQNFRVGVHYMKSFVLPLLKSLNPIAVHLPTEMPGVSAVAKRYLNSANIPYTTAFHTRSPEFVRTRAEQIPVIGRAYGNLVSSRAETYLLNFHNGASRVMTSTPSMKQELIERYNVPESAVAYRTMGVNSKEFYPRPKEEISPEIVAKLKDQPRPYVLWVGRVSAEKRIADFINIETKGTKIVVGDGPDLAALLKEQKNGKYSNIVFVGHQSGKFLQDYFAYSDVFVFTSKTDTFGLVNQEALASGTAVVAYDVPGGRDIPKNDCVKASDNLEQALLEITTNLPDRQKCREFLLSLHNDWSTSSLMLLDNLAIIPENAFP